MSILKCDGFSYEFDSSKCDSCGGKCCTGESGYIWINDSEMKALADFLSISKDELISKYLIKVKYKYSIKESEYQNGYACVFFDRANKNCSIYHCRPSQCKSFPFWDYFKNNLKELKEECIGVN